MTTKNKIEEKEIVFIMQLFDGRSLNDDLPFPEYVYLKTIRGEGAKMRHLVRRYKLEENFKTQTEITQSDGVESVKQEITK